MPGLSWTICSFVSIPTNIDDNDIGYDGLLWLPYLPTHRITAANIGTYKLKEEIAAMQTVSSGWWTLTYNNILYERNYMHTKMEGIIRKIYINKFSIN